MVVTSLTDNLGQLHLRLGSNFTVSSVLLDGRPVTSTFDDSTHLTINFDQTYAAGSTFTVVIAYSGITNGGGFGSISFGTHAGAPYCFTLSEPWLAYTWWPNKDDNTDKALMSIAVTVPNTMQVAANGLLQGVDPLSGNRSRYRWASTNPMAPYLLCFGATNFNHFSDTFAYSGGTMPLEFYIWPENDNTSNRNGWLHVKQMLATLGQWYGEYPFVDEKYGIYQFNFGGGMEHQTMTGENSFGDNLSVHELGHQWWGDNVTCATWSDIWLNEGFATYTEAVWLEKKAGSTGLPALKAAMQARRPSAVNDTVYIQNPTDINRIFSNNFTYLKGGWVLHMLRHVLGDAPFWDAMGAYRALHNRGTATTADFQQAMQSATGRDLTTFFQQWVYQPGAPQYQYGWQNLTANGQNYLAMHVRQVQSASFPVFAMPIDSDVTAGSTSRVVLLNSASTQNYLIPVAQPVTAMTLDPDGWILNTGIANVAYQPGPPKVIGTSPVPDSTVPRGTPIRITFHTPVRISTSDVTLFGPITASSYSYGLVSSPTSNTATFLVSTLLPAGQYQIRIRATVTAVDSGQSLDGESNGKGQAAFPSGDGVPGGDFIYRFRLQ